MTFNELADPILITEQGALKELVKHLSLQPILAVDTESNSLYAYREQVCLIQFSVPGVDYLVDPLALADLSPLSPLFCDAGVEKVFHAAEYDVICLRRDFGFEFENLFDTMVAARILGRQAVGLGSLLQAEFGVTLNKRYQRANWGQRPLPEELLDYARLDTHHLIDLRDILKTELEAKGLSELAQEDFRRVSLANGHAYHEPHVDPWRVSGTNELDGQQMAVLHELCKYRDQVAQKMDRPLFKVFNDRTLLEIARALPGDTAALKRVDGVSYKHVRFHGEGLLKAVEHGLAAKPLFPPRQTRPDEDYLERVEALRRWRKSAAIRMGVSSDVVLPRDMLYTLAKKNPRGKAELEGLMADVPWRRERFGEQILEIMTRLRT